MYCWFYFLHNISMLLFGFNRNPILVYPFSMKISPSGTKKKYYDIVDAWN